MLEAAGNKQKAREEKKPAVGSLFISNYPPYSFWSHERVAKVVDYFGSTPRENRPMGLYLHIPFCRKRCKFCYFKVYTDKNSREIQTYLDAVEKELTMLSRLPAVSGRQLKFLYVGGGTPSYIGGRHLRHLMAILKAAIPWEGVEEVTFECEPGTLTETKLEAIREVGVTRLSLGVESFDDAILRENGRAHVSTEIYRVLPWIRALGFEQFNIDLIAGMVGESWDNWRESIHKAIEMDPDSITIYQMELPYNTLYSHNVLEGSSNLEFADFDTKRAWHDYAINSLRDAGYEISSAYTMVKRGRNVRFRYRDSLWQGADLLAVGVSSFGHMGGLHYQNDPAIENYNKALARGDLPVKRAYETTPRDRLTREMILQLKLGRIGAAYFRDKFGEDILRLFQEQWRDYQGQGYLNIENGQIILTREGLLRVDSLLPAFYQDHHQNARYT